MKLLMPFKWQYKISQQNAVFMRIKPNMYYVIQRQFNICTLHYSVAGTRIYRQNPMFTYSTTCATLMASLI